MPALGAVADREFVVQKGMSWDDDFEPSVDIEERTVEAFISTYEVDRDGEIVLPGAYDKNIGVYKSNPILIASHLHKTMPIGKCISLGFRENGIWGKYKLATTQAGEEALILFAEGCLRGFSPGFIPLKFVENPTLDILPPGALRTANGKRVKKAYVQVELVEVSALAIPSNRRALVEHAEKGNEIAQIIRKGFEVEDKGDEEAEARLILKEWTQDKHRSQGFMAFLNTPAEPLEEKGIVFQKATEYVPTVYEKLMRGGSASVGVDSERSSRELIEELHSKQNQMMQDLNEVKNKDSWLNWGKKWGLRLALGTGAYLFFKKTRAGQTLKQEAKDRLKNWIHNRTRPVSFDIPFTVREANVDKISDDEKEVKKLTDSLDVLAVHVSIGKRLGLQGMKELEDAEKDYNELTSEVVNLVLHDSPARKEFRELLGEIVTKAHTEETFEEEEHPRNPDGTFKKKVGGEKGSASKSKPKAKSKAAKKPKKADVIPIKQKPQKLEVYDKAEWNGGSSDRIKQVLNEANKRGMLTDAGKEALANDAGTDNSLTSEMFTDEGNALVKSQYSRLSGKSEPKPAPAPAPEEVATNVENEPVSVTQTAPSININIDLDDDDDHSDVGGYYSEQAGYYDDVIYDTGSADDYEVVYLDPEGMEMEYDNFEEDAPKPSLAKRALKVAALIGAAYAGYRVYKSGGADDIIKAVKESRFLRKADDAPVFSNPIKGMTDDLAGVPSTSQVENSLKKYGLEDEALIKARSAFADAQTASPGSVGNFKEASSSARKFAIEESGIPSEWRNDGVLNTIKGLEDEGKVTAENYTQASTYFKKLFEGYNNEAAVLKQRKGILSKEAEGLRKEIDRRLSAQDLGDDFKNIVNDYYVKAREVERLGVAERKLKRAASSASLNDALINSAMWEREFIDTLSQGGVDKQVALKSLKAFKKGDKQGVTDAVFEMNKVMGKARTNKLLEGYSEVRAQFGDVVKTRNAYSQSLAKLQKDLRLYKGTKGFNEDAAKRLISEHKTAITSLNRQIKKIEGEFGSIQTAKGRVGVDRAVKYEGVSAAERTDIFDNPREYGSSGRVAGELAADAVDALGKAGKRAATGVGKKTKEALKTRQEQLMREAPSARRQAKERVIKLKDSLNKADEKISNLRKEQKALILNEGAKGNISQYRELSKEAVNEVKKATTRYEKAYITTLEKSMPNSIRSKFKLPETPLEDYKRVGREGLFDPLTEIQSSDVHALSNYHKNVKNRLSALESDAASRFDFDEVDDIRSFTEKLDMTVRAGKKRKSKLMADMRELARSQDKQFGTKGILPDSADRKYLRLEAKVWGQKLRKFELNSDINRMEGSIKKYEQLMTPTTKAPNFADFVTKEMSEEEFEEHEHPRNPDGTFKKKVGGSATSTSQPKTQTLEPSSQPKAPPKPKGQHGGVRKGAGRPSQITSVAVEDKLSKYRIENPGMPEAQVRNKVYEDAKRLNKSDWIAYLDNPAQIRKEEIQRAQDAARSRRNVAFVNGQKINAPLDAEDVNITHQNIRGTQSAFAQEVAKQRTMRNAIRVFRNKNIDKVERDKAKLVLALGGTAMLLGATSFMLRRPSLARGGLRKMSKEKLKNIKYFKDEAGSIRELNLTKGGNPVGLDEAPNFTVIQLAKVTKGGRSFTEVNEHDVGELNKVLGTALAKLKGLKPKEGEQYALAWGGKTLGLGKGSRFFAGERYGVDLAKGNNTKYYSPLKGDVDWESGIPILDKKGKLNVLGLLSEKRRTGGLPASGKYNTDMKIKSGQGKDNKIFERMENTLKNGEVEYIYKMNPYAKTEDINIWLKANGLVNQDLTPTKKFIEEFMPSRISRVMPDKGAASEEAIKAVDNLPDWMDRDFIANVSRKTFAFVSMTTGIGATGYYFSKDVESFAKARKDERDRRRKVIARRIPVERRPINRDKAPEPEQQATDEERERFFRELQNFKNEHDVDQFAEAKGYENLTIKEPEEIKDSYATTDEDLDIEKITDVMAEELGNKIVSISDSCKIMIENGVPGHTGYEELNEQLNYLYTFLKDAKEGTDENEPKEDEVEEKGVFGPDPEEEKEEQKPLEPSFGDKAKKGKLGAAATKYAGKLASEKAREGLTKFIELTKRVPKGFEGFIEYKEMSDEEFDEPEHPRAKDGKFTDGPDRNKGSGQRKAGPLSEASAVVAKAPMMSGNDRSAGLFVPEEIAKLQKICPRCHRQISEEVLRTCKDPECPISFRDNIEGEYEAENLKEKSDGLPE